MKIAPLVSILALAVCTSAGAVESASDSCAHEQSQSIAFRSRQPTDRLRVSVGTGPCRDAKLTFLVESSAGRQLYRATVDLRHQDFFDWSSPELPTEVRTFIDKLAAEVAKPVAGMPELARLNEEVNHHLLVSPNEYKRNLASGQNVFHHQTYYEGGVYFIYDAKLRKSRRLAAWSL